MTEARTKERLMDGSGLGSSTPVPRDPPLVEATSAPEFYADSFASLVVINGVAKLAFMSVSNGPGEQQRRIIARLTLSLPGVVELHGALGQLVEQMKAQGVMQTP
jgi:hypothetical protein